MLSKSQISFLKSLQNKNDRHAHGFFLVEGFKSIIEFINSPYHVEAIYHTASFDPKLLKLSQKINLYPISDNDNQKISSLKTPQEVIALVQIPVESSIDNSWFKQKFTIVLDGVQDPGNMGTIIRIADWFGFGALVCSADTVDAYNPKVVQASMGSLARVQVHYTELAAFIRQSGLPVFGAVLDGNSLFETGFGSEGFVVMGNEGNGLRPEIERLITQKVTIPRYGGAESLNVGIATALFCSEIRRNIGE